jgi:hypothetical protein
MRLVETVLGKGEWEREVEGDNSSMIYLIHCKNLCKCYNIPTPSTAIKTFSKGGGGGKEEKWPKPCMHIWIIKGKKKRNIKKF